MALPIAEFERGTARMNLVVRILAGVGLVFCTAGLLWGLGEMDGANRGIARVLLMTPIGIVGCLVWIASTFLPNKGLRALEKPEDLVAYHVVTLNGAVNSVSVRNKDGKMFLLHFLVNIPGEGDRAIEKLVAHAPHLERVDAVAQQA